MTTLLAQFAIADCLCRCGTLVQVLATQGSDRNSKTEQTQKLSRVCSDGESPTEFTVRNETYETDLKVNCQNGLSYVKRTCSTWFQNSEIENEQATYPDSLCFDRFALVFRLQDDELRWT